MCCLSPRPFTSRRLQACRARYFPLGSKTTLDLAGPDASDNEKLHTQSQPQPRPLRTAPQPQSRSSLPRALRFGRQRSPRPQMTHSDMGFASSTMVGDQHLRLLLAQLPFRTATEFDGWTGSDAVAGSWWEFATDFYKRNTNGPEPDKSRTARRACNALNNRTPQYLIHHPSKEDWTAEDHHVRFIVAVIHDSILQGVWSEADWKARGIFISEAVFEVLSYLGFMARTHGSSEDVSSDADASGDTTAEATTTATERRAVRVTMSDPPSYSSVAFRAPNSRR